MTGFFKILHQRMTSVVLAAQHSQQVPPPGVFLAGVLCGMFKHTVCHYPGIGIGINQMCLIHQPADAFKVVILLIGFNP